MKAYQIVRGMMGDGEPTLTAQFKELVLGMSDVEVRLSDSNALRHATRGIGRRLSILRVNILHILRLTDRPENSLLYGEEGAELTTHLNSFYIHLHGVLDNLAWMLAYELKLFAGISEDNPSVRNKIGLFNREFMKTLRHADTIKLLEKHSGWHSDTKRLRDPIAHRIPLYAVPCVMSHEEAEKFTGLHNEEMAALRAGNCAQSHEFHEAKSKIGKYYPVFATEGDIESVLSIKERVEQDSAILAEILWHFIEVEDSIPPPPSR